MSEKKAAPDFMSHNLSSFHPENQQPYTTHFEGGYDVHVDVDVDELSSHSSSEDIAWDVISEGVEEAKQLFATYQVEVSISLLSLMALLLLLLLIRRILHWNRNRFERKRYELQKEIIASPEELFAEKLLHEEYDDALSLAHRFNLDPDPIFQQQWSRSSVISLESIELLLKNVKNRNWVLSECLDKIPDSLEATKALLEHGLSLTSYEEMLHLSPDQDEDSGKKPKTLNEASNEDPIKCNSDILPKDHSLLTLKDVELLTPEQRSLICFRVQLLKYQDRLMTYEGILGGEGVADYHFKKDVYAKFREDSIMKSALSFAQSGNHEGISVLFSLHGKETLDHWLLILSNFPEVLSPVMYQSILPEVSSEGQVVCLWQQQKLREEDWSEKLIHREDDSNTYASLIYDEEKNRDLRQFRGFSLLNKTSLRDWFILRAKQIEKMTGLPNHALELIKLGMDRNIPALVQIHSDLETFCTLVYDCLSRSNEPVNVSLDQFLLMTPSQVIDLLMIGVETMDGKTFTNCIKSYVIPYVRKIDPVDRPLSPTSKGSPGKKNIPISIFLEQFLVKTAKTNLSLVKAVFEASVDEANENHVNGSSASLSFASHQEPIIERVEDLLRLSISVIYANEDPLKYLDDCFEIIGFLPQRVPDSTQEINDLQDEIDVLEKYLAVCEACLKYCCPVSPKRLKHLSCDADASDVKRFFNEVIRSANKSGLSSKKDDKSLSDQEWKQMMQDMLLIHDHLFQSVIPVSEVKELFIKCLLSFGRERFPLSIKLMKDLGVENCTQLILEAAKDYVNSANSLTDKKTMTLAKTCLNLLSHEAIERHPEVREERDFIQALAVIADNFDFHFLPIQIRLMEQPRLEVIDKLLKSTSRGYKKIGQLLNIADLLRVCRDSDPETQQTQVLILVGEAALLENDFSSCMTVCSKLMQMKKNTSGWRLCLKLGINLLFDDFNAKHKLLSFALTNCDFSHEDDQGKRLAFILYHIERLETDILRMEERKRLQKEIPLKVIKGSAEVIKGSAEVISRESTKVIAGSAQVLTNELSKTAQDFTSWLLPTLKIIKNDLVDKKKFAYAPDPPLVKSSVSPPIVSDSLQVSSPKQVQKDSLILNQDACFVDSSSNDIEDVTQTHLESRQTELKDNDDNDDNDWDEWEEESLEDSSAVTQESNIELQNSVDVHHNELSESKKFTLEVECPEDYLQETTEILLERNSSSLNPDSLTCTSNVVDIPVVSLEDEMIVCNSLSHNTTYLTSSDVCMTQQLTEEVADNENAWDDWGDESLEDVYEKKAITSDEAVITESPTSSNSSQCDDCTTGQTQESHSMTPFNDKFTQEMSQDDCLLLQEVPVSSHPIELSLDTNTESLSVKETEGLISESCADDTPALLLRDNKNLSHEETSLGLKIENDNQDNNWDEWGDEVSLIEQQTSHFIPDTQFVIESQDFKVGDPTKTTDCLETNTVNDLELNNEVCSQDLVLESEEEKESEEVSKCVTELPPSSSCNLTNHVQEKTSPSDSSSKISVSMTDAAQEEKSSSEIETALVGIDSQVSSASSNIKELKEESRVDPVAELTKKLLNSRPVPDKGFKSKGNKTSKSGSRCKPKVTPVVIDDDAGEQEEWQDWDDASSKVSSSASSLKSVDVKSQGKKPIVLEEDSNEGWDDW